MASIGGLSFLRLYGGVNPAIGMTVQEITRPNVDGVAYRKIGKRGTPFRMRSIVDMPTASLAGSTLKSYVLMKGTLVSVIEENGNLHNNVLVLEVSHRSTRPIIQAVGGLTVNPRYLLTVEWMLQMTETV